MSEIGDFIKHYFFGHQAPSQFISGLKSEIGNSLQVDTDSFIESIKEQAKEIEKQNESSIVDAPSRRAKMCVPYSYEKEELNGYESYLINERLYEFL